MTNDKCCYIVIAFLTACSGGGGGSSSGSQQNTAPEIMGLAGYVVDENTSTVATIEATDADGDTVTYSLSGLDASLLSIDSSSGLLTFQSPPDYQNPQDDNRDKV